MAYTLLSAGTASRNSSISYSESKEAGSTAFSSPEDAAFTCGCAAGLGAAGLGCAAFAVVFLASFLLGI